ncbi:MAG TPA: SgcJ/EcaC family oxidoreductase [Pyrinomonadaceae bacterium]|nr:SgcJ/EcaC family oxidoreductase [Pyrinomonadaceae bacterium]
MSRHFTNRMIFVALAALAALQLSVAAQASGQPSGSDDDAAIRENVRQLEAGWNSKSGALFAKPFAEDADYVVINGLHIRGREAIGAGHQQIFDSFMKETTLALTVKQTRYIRPDVAVVHVGAHLKAPKAAEGAREADAAITLVMSKEKSGWQIVAFQNTQVANDRH